MEFYRKLYVSPRIRNPRKIKKDLQRGKGHLTIYLVILADGPQGQPQLEIMHCANLQTEYYRVHPPLIVGMAEGKTDAIDMVKEMTQEAFEVTGQWNAAVYLHSLVS